MKRWEGKIYWKIKISVRTPLPLPWPENGKSPSSFNR